MVAFPPFIPSHDPGGVGSFHNPILACTIRGKQASAQRSVLRPSSFIPIFPPASPKQSNNQPRAIFLPQVNQIKRPPWIPNRPPPAFNWTTKATLFCSSAESASPGLDPRHSWFRPKSFPSRRASSPQCSAQDLPRAVSCKRHANRVLTSGRSLRSRRMMSWPWTSS